MNGAPPIYAKKIFLSFPYSEDSKKWPLVTKKTKK